MVWAGPLCSGLAVPPSTAVASPFLPMSDTGHSWILRLFHLECNRISEPHPPLDYAHSLGKELRYMLSSRAG
jgi:hypothetical protein